ncbi:MAG: AbrB/MazE/SpoVT family DNA-binding domain-containing protein [Methylobacter tundripaludum]|nr:AbrB/MazE/SpoVT family DNA-binding domain-containing protein [Methylobacter tundripaludum]
MNQQAVKISAGGRIELPVQMRASLSIHEGDELLISVVNGEIHITPKALALQNALAIVRKHLAGNPDLSDALIADRRKEVQ